MRIRVLGPLEVEDDSGLVELGGVRQRSALAYLLLHANQVVSTSQLLAALWPADDAPMTARKILQNAVWRLRGALSGDRPEGTPPELLTRSPGYVLRVAPDQVDLLVFQQRVAEGRAAMAAGDPAAARELLTGALSLWRGGVLADLVEEGTCWPELASIENERLDVLEDWFEVELACGGHQSVLHDLKTLAEQEPLRERAAGQLMLALYRCGRQADALAVYGRLREALVDNLGLEPSPDLQRLQQAVLVQDPSLDLPARPSAPVVPQQQGRRGALDDAPGTLPPLPPGDGTPPDAPVVRRTPALPDRPGTPPPAPDDTPPGPARPDDTRRPGTGRHDGPGRHGTGHPADPAPPGTARQDAPERTDTARQDTSWWQEATRRDGVRSPGSTPLDDAEWAGAARQGAPEWPGATRRDGAGEAGAAPTDDANRPGTARQDGVRSPGTAPPGDAERRTAVVPEGPGQLGAAAPDAAGRPGATPSDRTGQPAGGPAEATGWAAAGRAEEPRGSVAARPGGAEPGPSTPPPLLPGAPRPRRPDPVTDAPAAGAVRRPDSPASGGGEGRPVSVVLLRFDLGPGFEALSAESLDQTLDAVTQLARERIEAEGGVMASALGSVLLGLFEGEPSELAAAAAVRAAAVVRAGLRRAAASFRPAGGGISARAAVTTGPAVVRRPHAGPAAPWIGGGLVSACEALLAAVAPDEVRVCDTTRRLTEPGIAYRPADGPLTSWAVEEVADGAWHDPGAATDCRDCELDLMRGMTRRSVGLALPHLLTVLGPGNRRSSLLTAFRQQLEDSPARVLAATCGPCADGWPAPAALLAAYAGIRPGDVPESVRAKLDAALSGLVDDRRRRDALLDRIDPLFHGKPGPLPPEALSAEREFLVLAAAREPLVVIWDDLHRADEAALTLVEDMVCPAPGVPLLTVAGADPRLLERRPDWSAGRPQTMTISLVPSADSALERLLECLYALDRTVRAA
ncbi:BTAD domain-containing putative transcriptional regulator [Streptomyces galbus]|uniref:BTAD domain-containing putative transcriptional regulator n=1 Tax=Streptomyces galbus TaxID=33898 RepID=UPI0037B3F4B1